MVADDGVERIAVFVAPITSNIPRDGYEADSATPQLRCFYLPEYDAEDVVVEFFATLSC